jgi:nitrate reductase gamma subunit
MRSAASGRRPAKEQHPMGIVPFDLYDLVRGPAFLLTFLVFACGVALRAVQFARFTRLTRLAPVPQAALPAGRAAGLESILLEGRSALSRAYLRLRFWERNTVFGTHPVMSRVSTLFHVLLFLCPLLLPAHNILAYQALGVSIFTLPETVIDWLTVALMAAFLFFLARRVVVARVRALTAPVDYLILALVAAPFVTAYLAYHQFFAYRTVLLVHMIVGEITIMAIPFTKLGHMPFLLFARFFVGGEYAWKPGNRRW